MREIGPVLVMEIPLGVENIEISVKYYIHSMSIEVSTPSLGGHALRFLMAASG
jgi:hypothetical protein